jgi:hypothetical protein
VVMYSTSRSSPRNVQALTWVTPADRDRKLL